jgi:hypothetical protein
MPLSYDERLPMSLYYARLSKSLREAVAASISESGKNEKTP